MKNVMEAALLLAVGAAGLTACASDDTSLQRATAMSVPGNVSLDRVAVSDVDRSLMSVTWRATINGRAYACSADDMVRRPYCSPSR
jgi:predicted secreted protein